MDDYSKEIVDLQREVDRLVEAEGDQQEIAEVEMQIRVLKALYEQATTLYELGRTDPNAAGRIYQHGTLTGYSLGSCRCEHCRNVYARYRAERRAAGTDRPRSGRTINTDGHLPRRWFAQHIWRPAVTAADLDFNVRVHDLRHAHASWLLAGGADVQVVKERLGHGSLRTTEKYLHILPDADETALDALRRTRTRTTR